MVRAFSLVRRAAARVRALAEREKVSLTTSLRIPPALLEAIDYYVERGLFENRSEFIRAAILTLLIQLRPLDELVWGTGRPRGEPIPGYR
ncbi:MAG: ribbon-helix-helix domain-containing protein [Armatimonadota bacterium]|nr:ribbon-helix-helix domain-containing protein [Armatimonadota bacterium]